MTPPDRKPDTGRHFNCWCQWLQAAGCLLIWQYDNVDNCLNMNWVKSLAISVFSMFYFCFSEKCETMCFNYQISSAVPSKTKTLINDQLKNITDFYSNQDIYYFMLYIKLMTSYCCSEWTMGIISLQNQGSKALMFFY